MAKNIVHYKIGDSFSVQSITPTDNNASPITAYDSSIAYNWQDYGALLAQQQLPNVNIIGHRYAQGGMSVKDWIGWRTAHYNYLFNKSYSVGDSTLRTLADVYSIMLGTNDAWRLHGNLDGYSGTLAEKKTQFKANLTDFVNSLKNTPNNTDNGYNGGYPKVILCTPPKLILYSDYPAGRNSPSGVIPPISTSLGDKPEWDIMLQGVREVAQELNCPLVDLYSAWEYYDSNPINAPYGNAQLYMQGIHADSDQHANNAGHIYMGQTLEPILLNTINKLVITISTPIPILTNTILTATTTVTSTTATPQFYYSTDNVTFNPMPPAVDMGGGVWQSQLDATNIYGEIHSKATVTANGVIYESGVSQGIFLFKLTTSKSAIKMGESIQVNISTPGWTGTPPQLTWSVDKPALASISSTGLLTGLNVTVGDVIVTATDPTTGVSASITITLESYLPPFFAPVEPNVTINGQNLEISQTISDLLETDQVGFQYGIIPDGQTEKVWFDIENPVTLVSGDITNGLWMVTFTRRERIGDYYFRAKVIR